jgi:hypothetical protein
MTGLSASTDVRLVVPSYDALHRLYTRLGAMLTILSSISIAGLPGYLFVEIAYIAPGIKTGSRVTKAHSAAARRSGERISNLYPHELSRHELHVLLRQIVHDLPRRGMESIAEVEEGNPCDRVHKDCGHASLLLRLPIEIVVVLMCQIVHTCFYHAILY